MQNPMLRLRRPRIRPSPALDALPGQTWTGQVEWDRLLLGRREPPGVSCHYEATLDVTVDSEIHSRNGLQTKIEKCDNDISQTWYYTDDNRVSLYGYVRLPDHYAPYKCDNEF